MPICKIIREEDAEEVDIFYETYGRGDIKILMIMGLAAAHDAWWPQIMDLAGTDCANGKDDYALFHHGKELGEGQEKGNTLSFSKTTRQENGRIYDVSHVEPPEQEAFNRGGEEGGERGRPAVSSSGRENATNERATGTETGRYAKSTGRMCCAFDNRGVGRSSCPLDKTRYTTSIMAEDALFLADHLGWKSFHVIGHSMGAMIASKLAAMAPQRVLSLALMSVSNGGFDLIPRFDSRSFRLAYRFANASTPELRANVDLDTHFSLSYLESIEDGRQRREALHEEYVKCITNTGMQQKHGLDGHLNACWTHSLTAEDAEIIKASGMLVAVIHGREDIIAHVSLGQRIADRLHPVSRMVELPGAHMVGRECSQMVNSALLELVEASEKRTDCLEWSNSNCCTSSDGTSPPCCSLPTSPPFGQWFPLNPWDLTAAGSFATLSNLLGDILGPFNLAGRRRVSSRSSLSILVDGPSDTDKEY